MSTRVIQRLPVTLGISYLPKKCRTHTLGHKLTEGLEQGSLESFPLIFPTS